MEKSAFQFDLPEELVAQYPLAERSDSRLLCLDRENGETSDRGFRDLVELLNPGDLLVFNNTRVIPARMHGRKESGGRVEIMMERMLDSRRCLAMLKVSKKPAKGFRILLEDGDVFLVRGRQGQFFELESETRDIARIMESHGHMPLPPYISRQDEQLDQDRYQTVYAEQPGAVAAPTAGLHFDDGLLEALDRKGVERAFVTLHVGAGTFQPVREERIEDHEMHAELLEVSEQVCEAVKRTRQRGGRVVAVGTTTVRSLETAAQDGELKPFRGDSRIFIYPGYQFRVVDAMITNFHLPESTLVMLVSAFAGLEPVLAAYNHAVHQRYRFFSYGDAMFIG